MIPSHKWFPSSMQERAAWFANYTTHFAVVGASLGFSAPEILAATDDNEVMQYLASSAVALDAYKSAVVQYRQIIMEGAIGDPAPTAPGTNTFTPTVNVPVGIFERLDNAVKRIRVAPAYTSEMGALLGIIPAGPAPQPESGMQPDLSVQAMPGNVVEVKFVRGKTDGVVVETKIDNAEAWSGAGRFFRSPAELVIPENPTGLPRSVQIRARYLDGNTPVGQYSASVLTATQPEG